MNEQEIKKTFRPLLPKGYIDIIQKRLKEKGITKSRAYISYVCNPGKAQYNQDIIEVALNLAAEQKRKQTEHADLAKDLTTDEEI